jgi:hypothetical protein
MCFSAEASFAVAGALVPMSVYCLRASARRLPRYWAFALIPFAFAVQQTAEGVVWLGLRHGYTNLVPVASGVYLFFAFAWWPFWFPFAATIASTRPNARRWLAVIAGLSSSWFFLAYLPMLFDPQPRLAAEIAHHSIRYAYADDVILGGMARWPATALYALCTGGPLLLLGRRELVVPVVLGIGSFVTAGLVYNHAYTSVWCFFAALLSAYCVYFFATASPDEAAGGG